MNTDCFKHVFPFENLRFSVEISLISAEFSQFWRRGDASWEIGLRFHYFAWFAVGSWKLVQVKKDALEMENSDLKTNLEEYQAQLKQVKIFFFYEFS